MRWPIAVVRVPSAIVRDVSAAAQRTIRPSRSDCCASAASSGSTPISRAPGTSARIATATPLASPPPPIGTRTAATSGRSSAISSPTVPWPAMIRSSSYGGMIARPRAAAISSATCWRSSLDVPTTTTCGAVGLDPGPLQGRRIGRHDDDRRRAEEPRGAGDALGVVARRVRDHAAGPLLGRRATATAT